MNRDLDTATDDDWRIASTRETILKPLIAKTTRSAADIDRAARALKLRRSMVFRLLNRYRADPQTSTLLPDGPGRKAGSFVLAEDLEEVIAREIEEFYLLPERPTVAALHRRIAHSCRKAGLEVPSYKAVAARVESVDLARRVALREGHKSADDQFAMVQAGLKVETPFELIQIDHTPADVIIVDDVDRLPIGRPWLTLAIDVATRVVAGFHISLEPPSSLSVALVISHLCLPKMDFLRRLEIDLDWPVHGLPQRIHLDNAKEFHGRALARGCREYGIGMTYRPPLQPNFGGHIERLIGTMMGEVHLLPGTTFSSVAARGEYDSGQAAVMTLHEFEQWFSWQVAGVYHQRVHSALGFPPLQMWKTKTAARPGLIRTVPDAQRFYLDFLPFELRKVRRDGIRLFNLQYCDSALMPLMGRSEKRYAIKYDPRDLSKVYLKNEAGELLTIPYRDLSRPPITLWEVRWATKRLRQQGRLAVDEENLFRAVAAQRLLIEQARSKTQVARRKVQQQRNRKNENLPSRPSIQPTAAESPDGPFQPYAYEVWDEV